MLGRPQVCAIVIVLPVVFMLWPSTFALGQKTTAGEKKTLTIAAYNLQNMFDVFDDPYTSDEQTRVKPREEIKAVAGAIRRLGADVIAVTEVENEGLLRAMVLDYLGDMGYDYIAVVPTNSGRGIQLGVLSRVPIQRVTSHRFRTLKLEDGGEERRFARDLMQIRLAVTPTQRLELFVAHFKSKRDDENDPKSRRWRLAEAKMAREIIRKTMHSEGETFVALAGDLNDTPYSKTLAAFVQKDGDQPALLADAHAALPMEKRITYLREPYLETIDYILLGPNLAQRLIPDSVSILDEKELLAGSDHAPVRASFKLD